MDDRVASRDDGDRGHYDFFVSYVNEDSDWAKWIAWQLEHELRLDGREPKAFLEEWDVVAGDRSVDRRHEALQEADRLVAVVSSRYLARSGDGRAVWSAMWSDNTGDERRIIPVRVEDCQPDGLLGIIHRIDLVDVDAAEAAGTLLSAITSSLRGRAVPADSPAFPGHGRPAPDQAAVPHFPGPPALVGEPPAVPPNWFKDRDTELEAVARQLGDPGTTAVVIAGREGSGKTAMIYRLRELVRTGRSPLRVEGFGYLSAHAFAPVTADQVVDCLAQMLPEQQAAALKVTLRQPLPPVEKLVIVLDALAGRQVVVAVDAVEELLTRDLRFADSALQELIGHLLPAPEHGVRLLLAGRCVPEPVRELADRSTHLLSLDEGLPAPHAFEFLRAMDTDGRLALDVAAEHDRGRLHRLTGGLPRALELVYAASEPPGRSLGWLLDYMERADGESMVVYLLALVLEQLSREERRVVQALAVYGRPVPPTAVDYLLREEVPTLDSRAVLERLCRLRLVRSDGGRCFSVPPVRESDHLLELIRRETGAGPTPEALLTRAADYFVAERCDDPKRTEDLRPQLSEIDLRLRSGAVWPAFRVIAEIDDHYLLGWGSSSAIVPPLQKLLSQDGVSRVLRVEATSMLARALMQQEDYDEAAGILSGALGLASGWGNADRRIVLLEQLCEAHLRLEDLEVAAANSRQAIATAARRGQGQVALLAITDLALCLAREGRFDAALRSFAWAARLLRRGAAGDDRTQVSIAIDQAWTYGQLGHVPRAHELLQTARRRALDLDDRRLEGMCLLGEAELALDDGRPDQVEKLAGDAAAIGVRNGNRALCRDAMEILAQARLLQSDVGAAARAADIARRNRCSIMGLILEGLIAYRRGPGHETDALSAFRKAVAEADRRRRPGGRNYQLLDMYGVAACGLALLDEPSGLRTAVAAFRDARQATTAAGAVGRVDLMLDHFGPRADPAIMDKVRPAAKGELSRSGGS
jgi:tetratricopeptide (TPR) repeat protein